MLAAFYTCKVGDVFEAFEAEAFEATGLEVFEAAGLGILFECDLCAVAGTGAG